MVVGAPPGFTCEVSVAVVSVTADAVAGADGRRHGRGLDLERAGVAARRIGAGPGEAAPVEGDGAVGDRHVVVRRAVGPDRQGHRAGGIVGGQRAREVDRASCSPGWCSRSGRRCYRTRRCDRRRSPGLWLPQVVFLQDRVDQAVGALRAGVEPGPGARRRIVGQRVVHQDRRALEGEDRNAQLGRRAAVVADDRVVDQGQLVGAVVVDPGAGVAPVLGDVLFASQTRSPATVTPPPPRSVAPRRRRWSGRSASRAATSRTGRSGRGS